MNQLYYLLRNLAGTFFFIPFLLVATLLHAQKPDLSTPITDGFVYATAMDSNYIYIGGSFSNIIYPSGGLARFSTTSDRRSATGVPYIEGTVYAVLEDGSGGWYIGGKFSAIAGIARNNLVHITASGGLDLSWNPNPNDTVFSIGKFGSDVYVGGSFTMMGGVTCNRMAKLDAGNGVLNAVFNANANGTIYSMAVDATDLYVGGVFSQIGGQPRSNLAKLNSDGYAYNWNPDPNNAVLTVALLGSDVLAGGRFTQIGGQSGRYISKLAKSDGLVNDLFKTNTNVDDIVRCIAVDGGDIYVGGDFFYINGKYRVNIAKLNWDGMAYSWNPTVNSIIGVRTISFDNNNKVYIGGDFSGVNGNIRIRMARLDKLSGVLDNWDPNINNSVNVIRVNGNDVWVGGAFNQINQVNRNGVARIHRNTGLLDPDWNPNANGIIFTIAVNGNDVYVSGVFTSVGGQSRTNLARLNNTTGAADAGWICNVNNRVNAIAFSGQEIYIGGYFLSVNGQGRNFLGKVSAINGDLDAWNPLSNNVVSALALKGNDLYVGGNFTSIGGSGISYLAKFNTITGNVYTGWVPSPNASVTSLRITGSNMYATGPFALFNADPDNVYYGIARFDISTQAVVIDPNFSNRSNIAVFTRGTGIMDSNVFVGGNFSSIGGQPRANMAKLNITNGNATNDWNISPNDEVYSFQLDKGNVYIGGMFSNVDGFATRCFAKLPGSGIFTWLGTVSAEWGNPANWSVNTGWLPGPNDDVVIPAGTLFSPDISNTTVSIRSLTIQAGATLQAGTGTFSVSGSFINDGILAGTPHLILSGSSAQQIRGTLNLANFQITNGAAVTITSGNTSIAGTLSINAGTLATNGFLTLKSTASATARVAALTGTPISGNVTVERYIPAKTSRKWSFLASPVSGSSIRNGWQDDMFITGTGTGGTICGTGGNQYNSNGFDAAQQGNASMFVYNATRINGSRWVSVPNTTTTNLTPGTGYRINVRGPRGVADANCTDQLTINNPLPPVATTLSATGTLMQGNINVPVYGKTAYGTGGNAYTLIGNPYASEVSIQRFYADNSTAISTSFWMYTPQNSNNNYSTYNVFLQQAVDFPAGYGNSDINIASGQAFFVERNNTADGTVTFRELHKSAVITTGNSFYRNTTVTDKTKIKLSNVADANINSSIFINYLNDPQASDTSVTAFDSYSFNTGNAFYIASLKGSNALAIQTRSAFSGNDTVNLVFRADTGNFKLSFSEFDQFITATEIKLIDNFTGTITDVRQNSDYNFSVTADTASYGSSRFRVVFRSATLPISGIALNGTSRQEGVQLNWTVLAETDMSGYVVERSSDGRAFTAIGQVKATGNNNSNHNYTYLDTKPLSNTSYYRIKVIGNNGEIKYSSIIKIQQGKTWSVQLYPNPVKDQLYITMNNTGSDEVYTFRIINAYGQEVLRGNGKSLSGKLSVNVSTLMPGVYQLQLVNSNGEICIQKFIDY